VLAHPDHRPAVSSIQVLHCLTVAMKQMSWTPRRIQSRVELSDLWLKAAHEGAARFDNGFHPFFQPGHFGHGTFQVFGVVPDRSKTLEYPFRCRQLGFGI
jgi:hypothetical protein